VSPHHFPIILHMKVYTTFVYILFVLQDYQLKCVALCLLSCICSALWLFVVISFGSLARHGVLVLCVAMSFLFGQSLPSFFLIACFRVRLW
jgi:hypothetical protein